MKGTYKIRPADETGGKIKNIIILILSLLLVFCIICLFHEVDVRYEPVVGAVQENTQLKERIAELESELKELKREDGEKTQNDYLITPPNDKVEGYEEYQNLQEQNLQSENN